jgi:tetratricopeptide (TPR) repeat protein
MSVIHAAVYAARRRVVPVIVTTVTTMAGLFSLAFGLGGASLMWGPVATSIFWGLAFSTLLTLFMIPLIYANFTAQPERGMEAIPPLRTSTVFSWHPGALLEYLVYRVALFGGKEEGFLEILEHPLLSSQYHEAVQFLDKKQYDKAIKAFEKMAENQPENASCNIFAAQALTSYMQEHGWDIGYYARARRYLGRATSLTDSSKRLAAVKRAFEALSLPDEQERPN